MTTESTIVRHQLEQNSVMRFFKEHFKCWFQVLSNDEVELDDSLSHQFNQGYWFDTFSSF
jgi:hypothetical protein